MKEKKIGKGELLLLTLCILIFAAFIGTVAWGGLGQTGAGQLIPNSGWMLSMIIFVLGFVLQVIYQTLAKRTITAINVILIWLKYVPVFALALWQTWYTFHPDWIGYVDWTDFHSSIYCTLLNGILYALMACSLVTELSLVGHQAKKNGKATGRKRETKRVVAMVLVAWLIFPILFAVVYFAGNPIGYYRAYKSANAFIERKYSTTDYQVESMGYNYRTGEYTVKIVSPTKIDEHFSLTVRGESIDSSYERAVTEKLNVQWRLNDEYDDLFVKANFWQEFGYDIRNNERAEIKIFAEDDEQTYYPTHENALTKEGLELNKIYDMQALGGTNGHVSITIDTYGGVNTQMLADILLEFKSLADKKGIPFHTLTVELVGLDAVHVTAYTVLYEDIYEEGLEKRISQ